jgi:hypothetical protein
MKGVTKNRGGRGEKQETGQEKAARERRKKRPPGEYREAREKKEKKIKTEENGKKRFKIGTPQQAAAEKKESARDRPGRGPEGETEAQIQGVVIISQ